MLAHLLSEFVGTSILLGTIAKVGQLMWIIAAFAVAKVLTSPISGGHLNPAVTLWAYLAGKVGASQAVHHVIGQLAAVLAVLYFV
jgi:glycerol uptake facilitator-like aquaporin